MSMHETIFSAAYVP